MKGKREKSTGRGQITLEALILMAGLFAFFAAWWAVIEPATEKTKALAVERFEQAAFERVSFSVRLANRLGEGTALSETVYLPVATRVWLDDSLHWAFGNTTWTAPVSGTAVMAFVEGRKTARVLNNHTVGLSWS